MDAGCLGGIVECRMSRWYIGFRVTSCWMQDVYLLDAGCLGGTVDCRMSRLYRWMQDVWVVQVDADYLAVMVWLM